MTQRRSLLTTVLLCLMVSAIVAKELISSKLLKQHLVKKGFIKESYKPAPQHEHLFQGNHLRTSASSSVGWAMASSWFNKEECTDAPNIVMGALTNVCFIDLSNVTAGARSFQYSCSPQGVVMQEYTGQDYCSPTSIVNATTIPYGCNYEPTVDGDILGDLMGIALNISCTDSLTLDLGNEYILTE